MNQTVVGNGRRFLPRFSNYRWIPWFIAACFLLIVAVNGGLVYFATESWPGLITDHAYNEGLAYNRVIAREESQAKLGWTFDIAFAQQPKSTNGRVIILARDAAGAPLSGLVLSGTLERPVEEMPSLPLAFVAQGDGRYTADLAQPRAGQWDIYFTARRGADTWHGGHRILVSAQ